MSKNIPLTVIIIFSLSVFNCNKENNNKNESTVETEKKLKEMPSTQTPKSDMIMDMESVPENSFGEKLEKKTASKDGSNFFRDQKQSENVFVAEFELGDKRYLEYYISLTYNTDDIILTRSNLLRLVNQYGFIRNSSYFEKSYMTSEIHVTRDKLIDFLMDLNSIGNLTQENINVYDHTDQLVFNNKKSVRESIRTKRRTSYGSNTTTNSRNFHDIEQMLEQSEDKLDSSEHEVWRIKDKTTWAKIVLTLKTPEYSPLKIPSYRDAFITLLNYLFYIPYYMILFFPFLVIMIILFFYRQKIFRFFSKKSST